MSTMAETVLALRKHLGETQQAFSNRLGASLPTVGKWEAGMMEPGPGYRAKMWRVAKDAGARDLALKFEFGPNVEPVTDMYRQLGPELLDVIWKSVLGIQGAVGELMYQPGLSEEDRRRLYVRIAEASQCALQFIEQVEAMATVPAKAANAEERKPRE